MMCFVGTLFTAASCTAVPTKTVQRVDGQVQLGNSHLGESYDTVLARARGDFKVEPQCEGRKVSLSRQRRAFIYDVCGFEPTNRTFASAPLDEVVYHFIERELVRVDVRAGGRGELLETVKRDMNSVFSSLDASAAELGSNSYEWVAGQQVGGVRLGTGASAGNVHVRLLDAMLQRNATWLAGE